MPNRLSSGEKDEHKIINNAAKPKPDEEGTSEELMDAVAAKNPAWDPKAEAISSIDYSNLEAAIFAHLSLFQQLTAPLPLAKKNLALTKLELDRVRAQIDIQIRDATAKVGAKITEAAIASKVSGDPRVYAAAKDYINAKEVLDEMEHNKDIMYHRESTIRNLIALKRADWTAASTL